MHTRVGIRWLCDRYKTNEKLKIQVEQLKLDLEEQENGNQNLYEQVETLNTENSIHMTSKKALTRLGNLVLHRLQCHKIDKSWSFLLRSMP